MANFLNDGSLIGFWPLNEPSGASVFLNYSPARSRAPSGISFDFHVAQAESQNSAQVKSVWPGTTTVFNPESGVNYKGYMVQGYWKLGADSSPYSRYLLLGNGCSQVREQTLAPDIANSGFTAGIWVYPNSNGYLNYIVDANTVSYDIITEATRAHCLFTQKQFASLGGWQLGVSGSLNSGAQFNSFVDNGQLTAYVSIERNGGVPNILRTPIESGCYTHLTLAYRYNATNSVDFVLYKNGLRAASGNFNPGGAANTATLANTTLTGRGLAIGGGDNANAGTNNYGGTCGWNHLVSGAYFFRRVLTDAEVADLHNGQSLQPLEGNRKQPIKVELTDSQLLAYYPFRSVGWPDVSKNHRPLIGPKDEGPSAHYIPVPGPFKGGAMLANGTNVSDYVAAPSGLLYDMLNARSWTIGAIAGPVNGGGRPNNMIFSIGNVGTQTTGSPTTTGPFTFGIAVTEITTPNRIRFSAYPLGNATDNVFNIDTATSGYFNGVSHHYTVAYDDSTKGIAFYLDGFLQGSGTLITSLTDSLMKVAGSGYPLMFGNGVATTSITDSTDRGVFAAGGQDMLIGPIIVMGRALLPEEIMYVAQSGIDTTSTWRTPYDARLVGYWPCSDFKLDDVMTDDRARVWDIFPGNLVRGDTTTKWSAFYNAGWRTNQFGTRNTPPELASYGILGITSGIFGIHGLSPGTSNVSDSVSARSSIANFTQRYKPVNEQNNTTPQNVIGDFVLGFEVTPSGNIPATPFGLTADNTKFEFNSTLTLLGNLGTSSSDSELRSFLTTVDSGEGSGVTIVFASRTGTFTGANYTGLVSGVIPYGIPSKILFTTKFDSPYNTTGQTAGETQVTVGLWISGVSIQQRRMTASTARVWNGNTPDSGSDDLLLEFGGEAGNDSIGTQISRDGGLGNIYLREIFLMRGTFDTGEIAALAASGIQGNSIAGYSPTLSKTQVTVRDTNLEGYWRFNGLDGGGSGTKDLSPKAHHLTPLSERQNAIVGGSTQSSRSIKFLPGPLTNSDLLVQASGLSYLGTTVTVGNLVPPFAVSGVSFDSPQNGFSVGFFAARRSTVTASTIRTLMTYGLIGQDSAASTTTDFNRGWNIYADANSNIKMCLSVGGCGYYENTNNASQSGQLVCGTYETDGIYEDLTRFNNYLFGNPRPPRLDFWSHYCWTWDPTQKELKCYVNGQEVDRKMTKFSCDPLNGGPPSGLNPLIPVNPAARMITFFSPQETSPWDFTAPNSFDKDGIIADVFYFSRQLTESEIRYIALNGIDGAVGTPTSGIIGGFIHGQDTGSGIIGGYAQGQDTGSGLIGGYIPGSIQSSGLIGGYVSGIVFADGTIGGFIRGQDTGSGLIGGYVIGAVQGSGLIGGYVVGIIPAMSGMIGGLIYGQDACSGIIGGFILGGLQGSMQFDGGFTIQALAAKDFDAQVVLRKTTSSDFDAKLIIFQAETGPIVDIITPAFTQNIASTPPFNQYFVGSASGTQGKSIVQTRWTFGDFTPAVSSSLSGTTFYPVQHNYGSSGVFIAKFEAIDSNGLHGSAIRIINAASGLDPVRISLSGVPRSGNAALIVDFITHVDTAPPGVVVTASLVNFDDGQSTITFNPEHIYTQPGNYKPVWTIRDSRGVIWCDSLFPGSGQ